jgi:WD40 repeat protein
MLCSLVVSALFSASLCGGDGVQPRTVSGRPLPKDCLARLSLIIPNKGPADYVAGETADGSFRLALAIEKEIQVWGWQRPQATAPVFRLAGHDARVVKLALSPDALTLAAADEGGTIVLWELQTGKSRRVGDGVGISRALAVTDGGKQVAAVGPKGVAVWEQGRRIDLQGHTGSAVALALSRDGKQLAAGTDKGLIRVWSGAALTQVSELPWKKLPNIAPKDADKDLPASAPRGRWSGKVALEYVHEITTGVSKLVFSPDGNQLAAAGGTVVRLWQVPKRKLLWEHNRHAFIVYDLDIRNSEPRPPYQGGRIVDLAFRIVG